MTSRASPLDALKPLAGRALEAALNRALALDPDTRDGLRALDGRRVALHLATPPLALSVAVAGDRLQVGPVREEAADLSVRSTLGGLIAQLPFLRNDDAPPVGKLRIGPYRDPIRALVQCGTGDDVDRVLVDGREVVAGGRVLGVDERRLLADAQREAERLWASVPEWDWRHRTTEEFSPSSLPPLEEDLT